MGQHPGLIFRKLVQTEQPLKIVGAINAYSALQARKAGHKALYLSGAGVANYSLGRPDDGQSLTLDAVLTDAARILNRVDLPLLVDVDPGFEDPEITVQELEKIGVAAIHMEDQIEAKLCGHLPGKQLVTKDEMAGRIRAALRGRRSRDFVVMARCDALSVEGLDAVKDRSAFYAEAGADMIFAEAMTDLEHYQSIRQAVGKPLLANVTEFGKTPLYDTTDLHRHGVDMALYPLSAARAMARSAGRVYAALADNTSQKSVVDQMQKRDELYETLDYKARVEDPAS